MKLVVFLACTYPQYSDHLHGDESNTPQGSFSGNNAASANVPSSSGDLVLGVLGCETCTSVTFTAPADQRWNVIAGSGNEIGAGATKAGASPSTMISASLGSSDHWAMGGIAIKPVGGSGSSSRSKVLAAYNTAPQSQVNARPRQAGKARMLLTLIRDPGVVWRSHYYGGSARIAMREDSDAGSQVIYLFSDHLGSTSVAYRPSDGWTTRQWYKPWGELRPGPGSNLPTDYQYTGQRNYSSIGMLWYGSRFYDAALGRFSQADSVAPRLVPQNIKNSEWLSLGLTVDYAAPNMLYQMGLMYRERLLDFQNQVSRKIIGQKKSTTLEDNISQNDHKKRSIDQEYKTDEPWVNFQKLTDMRKLPRLELMNKRDLIKDKKGQPEPINPRLTLTTFDRYSYTMNCPTGFNDPTGYTECDVTKAFFGVVTAGLGGIITGFGLGVFAKGALELSSSPITSIIGLTAGAADIVDGGVIMMGGVGIIAGGVYIIDKSGCLTQIKEKLKEESDK